MFSVIISVYNKENPSFFKLALESMINQILLPDEILIIEDGPLNDKLENVIKNFKTQYGKLTEISSVKLKQNLGLGLALKEGVANAKYEYIVRMDSDDISSNNRLSEMKRLIIENPDYHVYGAQIQEFDSITNNNLGIRKVKLNHEMIKKNMRITNPMNHVTIVARKESILQAGNYENFSYFEDYFLWAKMLSQGFKFINSPLILVHVRAGSEMVRRRKGLFYAKQEIKMQKYLLQKGITSPLMFSIVCLIRSGARILPSSIISILYRITRHY